VHALVRVWLGGYGGNGTTYAAIAADVLVGALSGRPDAVGDLHRCRNRPVTR